MSNSLSSRAHLEAVLLVRVLLDPPIAERIEVGRLSPAAQRLLFGVVEWPLIAQNGGFLVAAEPTDDEEANAFVVRLAKRAESLSVMNLTFFTLDCLIAMVNALPHMGVVDVELQRAQRMGKVFADDVLERRRRSA